MLGLQDRIYLLKIGTPVPPPRKLIVRLLSNVDGVLVVEELEPIVEDYVKKVAFEEGFRNVRIYGKEFIPTFGELSLDIALNAISKFTGIDSPANTIKPLRISNVAIPQRPPTLCPGCPHRATFYALRKALNLAGVKAVYPSDIGCYTLGIFPPFEVVDTCVCMGGGIGVGGGLGHFQDKIVVVIIGDSTFYHTGIPGLVNVVYNKAPILIVVLNNGVTAMTGHQPHPGAGYTALGEPAVKILIEEHVVWNF